MSKEELMGLAMWTSFNELQRSPESAIDAWARVVPSIRAARRDHAARLIAAVEKAEDPHAEQGAAVNGDMNHLFVVSPDDCEHDDCTEPDPNDGSFNCENCGVKFLECPGCSEAGGADRGVFHAEPLCRSTKETP